MNSVFKIILKGVMALMLFGCLLHWQYSYYQILRWLICAGFVLFAVKEDEEGKRWYITVPCIAIAILFNPIIPIHLTRETWQPIDVSIGVALFIWIVIDIVIALKYGNKEKSEESI